MWKYLLEKEFKQFFRDPGLPRMVLMFPLLIIFVFPYAVSMEIRNINLVVVDSSRSTESAELIESCTESGYFRLRGIFDNPEEAMELMDRNRADAIITIDKDFSREFGMGTSLPVGIKVNTVNGTKGSIAAQYVAACLRMFMAEKNPEAGTAASAQMEISEKYYYNPYMDYKVFMVPALIVIAITMVCGFLPSLNIVGEKEKGTIEQINVTPVNKGIFIICKLIPYWLVAFFMMTACLILAWLVFGYTCAGNVLSLYFFTFLQIMVMAGMGLLISNYSNNAQQAMFVIWFFVMIFMLMSGIFTPIASMPEWAQYITYVNPLRYYADAMRFIYLKGSSIIDVWQDAAGLLGIGLIMVSWAIYSYRKTA